MKRLILIFSCLTYLILNIQAQIKVTSESSLMNKNKDKKHKNKEKLIKICETKEECRDCFFEELKHYSECQQTGQKILKVCNLYDGSIKVDDFYLSEPCNQGFKINSVICMLLFFIFTAAMSLYVRKFHRKILLNYTLEKLTINKEK